MKTVHKCSVVLGATALLLATGMPVAGQPMSCAAPGLTAGQEQTLVGYVRKKYKLPSLIVLSLQKDNLVNGTCYRELTFQGKSEIHTWELTLFLSPDLRFLTDELMDTQRDPAEEERAQNQILMSGLTQGATTVRGPENAAVTIVEFSDFQCPFCRRFAQILDEVLADDARSVRVVFHHMPLAGHDWARLAAEGAACAQLQGPQAFWRMHDQLFRGQQSITADNLKEKLGEFARESKGLDANAFQQCMQNSMSLGLVLRDLNLAEANQVTSTPTLFINGHRVQGVENAARLRELIAAAQAEVESSPAPAEKRGATGTGAPEASPSAQAKSQEPIGCGLAKK